MQQDFTQGPILRHLIGMAGFIGLGLVFQTLYFLVDLYFVSRLGAAAIAGVSAAGAVFFLIMALTQLVSVGAMSLIAHAMGAKDPVRANLVCNQAISLALAFAVATFIVIALFGARMVAIVGADAATDAAAQQYLFSFVPGLALMFPSATLGIALRASGVIGPPMMLQSATVLLNIVLAPVLIAGWLTGVPLGVAGAGWASSIAAAVGFLGLLALFPRVQSAMRLSVEQARPRFETWGRIVNVGLPATFEFLVMFVIMSVVYYVIREFGANAQAGFGVGSRVMQSIFLPVMAVGFAAGPIAGQNFGARNGARVREAFMTAAIVSSTLMAAVTIFANWRPDLLLRPFTEEPEALGVAEDYLRISSLTFVASGLVFTCSAMFQALGDTRPSLLASGSRLLTFAAPALWLTQQPNLTLHSVWVLSASSVAVQMLLCLWLLRGQLRSKLAGIA